MQLLSIIRALSSPAAYPFPVTAVEVHQTHISAVFLAGPFAFKIKKPVAFGFLDFSTIEKRRHFCEEEVRLNRRLAPSVYLGVVPIGLREDGTLMLEAAGEPIEWAVKMRRLPAESTLEQRLLRGQVNLADLHNLARRLAAFHAHADRSAEIARFGAFATVAGNARENFEQARPEVGVTVHEQVFARLSALVEATLERLHSQIDARAARGAPCDTHGDLHLDHVYFFPDRPPPVDIAVIDCIEFNDRFRFADPIADAAFLAMDLKHHGRGDLAAHFAGAYLRAAGDEDGRPLLPYYKAYRAMVRAKVDGFQLRETEIDPDKQAAAARRARALWLLALGELEAPANRPCLLLFSGLPGAGKSTQARQTAAESDFTTIRSDVVRKELAAQGSAPDLYTPAWTERTYQECRQRAEQALFAGRRVIVDATFREDKWRSSFRELAAAYDVPIAWFHCVVPASLARQRLEQRRGDVSDADWRVYQLLAEHWEAPSSANAAIRFEIDTSGTIEEAEAQVRVILCSLGLDGNCIPDSNIEF
jgi:uncharacterized protein